MLKETKTTEMTMRLAITSGLVHSLALILPFRTAEQKQEEKEKGDVRRTS